MEPLFEFFMKEANINPAILGYINFSREKLNIEQVPIFYVKMFEAIKNIHESISYVTLKT